MVKKSTPKAEVNATAFDLAVIAVVETLDGNRHLLQKGYKKFDHKGELLEWLGISRHSWGDIMNHRRHVPTRGKTTKEMIIDKLVRQFEVNREFLETNRGSMFKSSILLEEPEIHFKSRQELETENEELQGHLTRLRKRVKELEKLADQQSQMLAAQVRQKVRQKPRKG